LVVGVRTDDRDIRGAIKEDDVARAVSSACRPRPLESDRRSLWTSRAGWTLRTRSSCRPLRALNTLRSLWSLWTSGTWGSRRTWAARSQRDQRPPGRARVGFIADVAVCKGNICRAAEVNRLAQRICSAAGPGSGERQRWTLRTSRTLQTLWTSGAGRASRSGRPRRALRTGRTLWPLRTSCSGRAGGTRCALLREHGPLRRRCIRLIVRIGTY
jgi:hypothetical protein